MIEKNALVLTLLTLVLVTGCDGGDAPPTPEVLAARAEARREACLSGEILRRAEDKLADLEASLPEQPGEGAVAAIFRAQSAAVAFQRAVTDHARLVHGATALRDSSFNHSAGAADSARYADRAVAIQIRGPEAGSVEANAVTSYRRELAALAADDAHPCNWEEPA